MTYKTPEEFIEATRTILNTGDFYEAQKLSMEAAEKYPDRQEVQKIARILAPSKITVDKERSPVDILANQNWVKQNRIQYRGRWVALKDGKFLADGKNVDELVEQVGDIKGKDIFITAIY
ncbi:MAG: DUF5678 domain-containing protein [Cyanobacteriota bacterium]|nr:DUF5678 domain-containing protein [Cyanobacteriota bacterium]